jgi:TolA-binding protein
MDGRYRVVAWAVLTAAVVAIGGCAGQADVEQVRNEEFGLRSMVASDRQQTQSLQQQIRREQDEIEELRHGSSGSGGEDLSSQIASMQDRLARLEATVNALRASSVPPPSAPPPPPGAASSAPPPPAAPTAWQTDLDKEEEGARSISGAGAKIYREGLQAMKDGKYQVAVAKFAQIQKRYPKSPLNEPAEYFSANALYESAKYDQSILQFNDLVMRYPKGRFACSGLLREAQAFQQLNDKIDARLTAQKLISDCGGTTEAAAASALMKDLQN